MGNEQYYPTPLPNEAGSLADLHGRAAIGKERLSLGEYFLYPNSTNRGYISRNEIIDDYTLPTINVMEDSETRERFEEPVAAMIEILSGHGVSLPDDLATRLFVVDAITFNNTVLQELGDNYYAYDNPHQKGILLPHSRFGIVNRDRVAKTAREAGILEDKLQKAIGVHELVHSGMYLESWAPKGDTEPVAQSSQFLLRRFGYVHTSIALSKPISYGLQLLSEGTTEHLVQSALERVGQSVDYSPYPSELALHQQIAAVTGEGPIYRAYYTEEGMRELESILNELYGPNALYRLGAHIRNDFRRFTTSDGLQHYTDYKNSKRLLEERQKASAWEIFPAPKAILTSNSVFWDYKESLT